MIFDKDTFCKYKIGAVVVVREPVSSKASLIGHIVGFELNSTQEVILSVKWAGEGRIASHFLTFH